MSACVPSNDEATGKPNTLHTHLRSTERTRERKNENTSSRYAYEQLRQRQRFRYTLVHTRLTTSLTVGGADSLIGMYYERTNRLHVCFFLSFCLYNECLRTIFSVRSSTKWKIFERNIHSKQLNDFQMIEWRRTLISCSTSIIQISCIQTFDCSSGEYGKRSLRI